MKKLLFTALIMCLTIAVSAQIQGRTFNLDSSSKVIKSEAQLKENSTQTTNKAIYKGKTYPVYQHNPTGKLFVIITSTKGTYYRRYIKP